MGFELGHKKIGGRKRGAPNRKTLVLQEALEAQGVDPVGRLCEILPQLSPKDQSHVLLELLGYLFPKRKAVEPVTPEGEAIHTSLTELIRSTLDDSRERTVAK